MKAVRVHVPGGIDALRYEDVPEPSPGAGEALVRHDASGVNFIDVYQRSGLYRVPVPFIVGREGAGVVTAVGDGVTGVRPGDRVAYEGVQGSYAELAAVPVERLVRLPDGVSTRTGAAIMLQGLTAHYLATSTYPLKPGDIALVHAAAGGVGLLLVQIAKRRGARVIATVSTDEKAALAREAGADDVILYSRQDFAQEALRRTGGVKLQVVYDSVGRDTFERGLDILAPRGMMVLFGQSSGPVGPFDPQLLNQKGSLYVTRPSLGHYAATRTELVARADELLGWVGDGSLKVRIGEEYPLSDARGAHRDLEGRRTTGKVLLVP